MTLDTTASVGLRRARAAAGTAWALSATRRQPKFEDELSLAARARAPPSRAAARATRENCTPSASARLRGCARLRAAGAHPSAATCFAEQGPPLARALPAEKNTRCAVRPRGARDGLWSAARAGMTAGSAPPLALVAAVRTPRAYSRSAIPTQVVPPAKRFPEVRTVAVRTSRATRSCRRSAHGCSGALQRRSKHPR